MKEKMKPKKVCNHVGCNVLIDYDKSYCAKHQTDKQQQVTSDYDVYANRKEIGGKFFQFYHSKAWKQLSYSYRLRNPMCEVCLKKDIYIKCDVVDHIIPIRNDWSKRLDENNLQALCHSCHNAKTRAESTRLSLTPLNKRG